MKIIGLLPVAVVITSILFSLGISQAEQQHYKEKRAQIEKLVNEATGIIKEKGEAALAIIREKDGKFNTNDAYVFVTSGETGADLLNPAFEAIEGMPVENYLNPDAEAAQLAIVDAVKDKDTAWLEYLWPKPGETVPSKKTSFLKKITVNGKVRIVGCGFYPDNN